MTEDKEEKEDELKTENDRLELEIKRHEELILRKSKALEVEKLGGESMAGQIPVPPVLETPKEYADRIMSGKKK